MKTRRKNATKKLDDRDDTPQIDWQNEARKVEEMCRSSNSNKGGLGFHVVRPKMPKVTVVDEEGDEQYSSGRTTRNSKARRTDNSTKVRTKSEPELPKVKKTVLDDFDGEMANSEMVDLGVDRVDLEIDQVIVDEVEIDKTSTLNLNDTKEGVYTNLSNVFNIEKTPTRDEKYDDPVVVVNASSSAEQMQLDADVVAQLTS